ncbi:MAG: glycosyltransferase [Fimbriiglobus sp.]
MIQLGKYYPPASGGIENHTQTLCQGLARLGWEVEVVVVNHLDSHARDVTFDRFAKTPCVTSEDGNIRIHRVGRVANFAKLDVSPGLLSKLRKLLQNPPNLWHLHAPNITMMLAVLALPKIRPLVITHHSDIVKQKQLYRLVKPFENHLYKRADLILSDSPTYINGSPLLNRFLSKVETLPLGIDLNPFLEPSAPSRAISDRLRSTSEPIWATVGRLIYYKGLDTALQALKATPGVLHIVGSGPMEGVWRQKVVELGLQDRVIWRGRVSQDELVGLYHAATAHWFPSNARSEGFGLVQVEAMASGCPTINCEIPHSGVSWVSPNEVSGLTVPMNDPTSFSNAANRLVNEPKLRARFSETGRKRAIELFSDNAMAQKCVEIYSKVSR